MAKRLEGKIAVVTAAGQGIGRRTAERFAEEGAKVYASDLDRAKLEGLDALGIETAALDVTDKDAIKAYCDRLPTPQIVFNCAGFVHHGTILD